MANILRIRDVAAYTTLDENAAESAAVVSALKSNDVPFQHLFWGDADEAKKAFDPLNTWTFKSDDGTSEGQKTFTRFPIVHYRAIFDDDSQGICVAVGLEGLQNSALMNNLSKVVRPS